MLVMMLLIYFVALSNMSIKTNTLLLGGFVAINYTNDSIQVQIRQVNMDYTTTVHLHVKYYYPYFR